MTPEIAKKWAWVGGLFLVVFALSAGTYWTVLKDPAQVLAFNDGNIEGALSPMFRFPDALWRIWDCQTFFGMGGRQSPLTITAFWESIGPEFWRRWGPVWVLGLCALAFFWMLRQYRIGRLAAALAAAFLAGTGACHNFSVAGLSVRPIAMACTALALGFLERGRCTGRWLPYAIGGGCLGLGISEVPDVGLLYALTTAVVFWWTHLWGKSEIRNPKSEISGRKPETGNLKPEGQRGEIPVLKFTIHNSPSTIFSIRSISGLLGKFFLYVVFSGLLAWQTIGTIFTTQIQGVTQGDMESPESRYAWATQWSVPPEEMWNAVSGSYFGRSIRSEEFPYWGRLGRDEGWDRTRQGFRNFSMTGWHLGVVPCILLLALLIHLLAQQKSSQGGGGGKGRVFQPQADPPVAETTDCCGRRGSTDHTRLRPSTSPGRADEKGERPDTVFPARGFIWMVFSIGVMAMLLMWGKYFPLYKLFWSLPYFGTFRNPEKWNGVLTLFSGIGVAVVLDALTKGRWAKGEEHSGFLKLLGWTAVGMAGLALLMALGTMANHAGFVAARLGEGYDQHAELMWRNALLACLKVALVAGLLAGGVWWWFGGRRQTSRTLAWLLGGAMALMLGGQFCDNRAYVQGHHYQHYLTPNPLTDFLDAHRTEGRIKLLPPRHPLLNNLRMTLLMVKGYDLFDPISVSRMPTDYAALFQALEKQPIRLWEMGALRYFLTLPGAVDELNKLDGHRSRFAERLACGVGVVNGGYVPSSSSDPQQQLLRLVEFAGALPKYRWASNVHAVPPGVEGDRQALARLGATDFQPAHETLIHANLTAADLAMGGSGRIAVVAEGPAEVQLEVETAIPGWLVRSVKFDSDWKVTLNGQPAELLRADFLFQAVRIPSGKHVLEFRYQPGMQTTWVALGGRVGLLLLLGACFFMARSESRRR